MFFYISPLLGAIGAPVFGPFWGLGSGMLLSGSAVLLCLCIFFRRRSGSFTRGNRLAVLRTVPAVELVKAGAAPAVLSAIAIYGWLRVHVHLREWVGHSIAEQPIIGLVRDRTLFPDRYDFYTAVVVIVLLVPVVEELIFRVVLYLPLRQRMGTVRAAVMVSVLFAVMHLYPAGDSVDFLMNALLVTGHLFIVSIFFTLLLERSRTVLAPVIGHAVYNAVVLALVF